MVTFLLLASLKFVDVAAEAGVTFVNVSGESDKQYIVEVNGNGAAFFDYDDGDMDLLVVNGSTLDALADSGNPVAALYRNDGGSFTDVTEASGLSARGWGMGVCVADVGSDGARDFYLTAYGPNKLFRNRGDGTFENVTEAAGITDPGYYGFGVVSGELDGDGWIDIYVANDSRPNFYFRNNGDGTFFDEALGTGLALNEEGRQEAGMGVDFGDYDNDGWLDVVVTNFSHETNTLYRGSAEGIFTDVTYLAGLGGSSIASLGWGVGLVDLDNDGWRDLFVANGHVYPEVDEAPTGTSWLQKKQLFLNEEGRFREVTVEVGGPLLRETSSRGVAFGDYDDDGDDDIFIVNLDAPPSLLRNDTDSGHHWLRVRLIGRGGNRDAIGARVTVDGKLREVRNGGSYLSHNDTRLGFGLGSAETASRVEVRWPGGKSESFESIKNVGADKTLTLVEGLGIVSISS